MKDFLKGSSFKALIIAVVVLLGLIIYTASAGGSFLADMLGFASTPMQGISTKVTDSALEFLDLDGLSKEELKQRYLQLEEENARWRNEVVDYYNLQKENEQLKIQLEISEAEPENEMLGASVIGRDPNDLFYGFSIDKGSLAGISVGDPVITSQGLVGIVTQAYATTSKVTCILSEELKVAAMSKKKEESGVITSDIQMAANGMVRLMYLQGDTKLEKGDIITTSGVGNVYPKDIIIGEVQSVEKSENDISKYALIKPYEDLTSVKDVFVIISFPGQGEGEDDVTVEPNPPSGEDAEETGK